MILLGHSMWVAQLLILIPARFGLGIFCESALEALCMLVEFFLGWRWVPMDLANQECTVFHPYLCMLCDCFVLKEGFEIYNYIENKFRHCKKIQSGRSMHPDTGHKPLSLESTKLFNIVPESRPVSPTAWTIDNLMRRAGERHSTPCQYFRCQGKLQW